MQPCLVQRTKWFLLRAGWNIFHHCLYGFKWILFFSLKWTTFNKRSTCLDKCCHEQLLKIIIFHLDRLTWNFSQKFKWGLQCQYVFFQVNAISVSGPIFSICFNATHALFLIKPNKAIIWPVINLEQYFKLDNLKWIIIIVVHQLKLHVY